MGQNSGEQSSAFSHRAVTELRLWAAFAVASLALAIASRFAHVSLVWIEEAYGLAAAAELLRGKRLYADIWFDKPPLYAWYYAACGALAGWPLRLLESALLTAIGGAVFGLARTLWGLREGLAAAGLILLALTFWIPSAVMAVAPDLLMILPHVLAVWMAVQRRPMLAGVASGVAVLCNSKGVLVLIAAAFWAWPRWGSLVAGFALVQAASLAFLPAAEYWRQVWLWGFRYSADTFIDRPLREALVRTLSWTGFHATAAIGTALFLVRTRDWRMPAWLLVALLSVAGGLRFFPRYYFQLLSVVAVAGARGLVLISPRWRVAALALLLIPAVRFGPRYVTVAYSGAGNWADTALMRDSHEAAALLRQQQLPGDTLLVWGYRPDVFVFSGLPAGTRFLDSQPLTGVLADRHLVSSELSYPEESAANRRELIRHTPSFIVDGLGPLNPRLAIERYPDLRSWLAQYEPVGRTGMSMIYRLRSRPDR